MSLNLKEEEKKKKRLAPASYRVSWQPRAGIQVPSDFPTLKLEGFWNCPLISDLKEIAGAVSD